jgi:hypothetical protein
VCVLRFGLCFFQKGGSFFGHITHKKKMATFPPKKRKRERAIFFFPIASSRRLSLSLSLCDGGACRFCFVLFWLHANEKLKHAARRSDCPGEQDRRGWTGFAAATIARVESTHQAAPRVDLSARQSPATQCIQD